jgi:polar amino acid transport system substrate-binding protein
MRRHQFLTALLALAAAPMRAQPSTRITVSTNNTPVDRQALEQLGQEAFRRIGLQLALTSLPSERSLVAANQGEVDGEGLRIAGLEANYPNLVRVPERFIGVSFVAFARNASIPVAGGWPALKPYRVAFINGWKLFEAQVTAAQSIHKVDKAEQLFQMLAHDRIDLALYTRADGLAMARSMGLSDVVALSPALKDVDMYLYLHKRHQALVPRLDKALQDMKSDGSWRRIMASVAVA